MPVLKTTNFVEFYRHIALSSGVESLAGRGDDAVGTAYANARILEALDPAPDDVLLDIGCGDGCLLRMAESRVRTCIGILPTAEEKAKLQAAYPGLNVLVGVAQKLPIETESACLIVCNSVLFLLKSEENVVAALREIARVTRPGAKIWLGEIPSANEFQYFKTYCGSSVIGLLWHELRKKGLRAFLSTAKTLLKALIGRETLVLNACEIFHAPPEKFIALAERCGLRPKAHFKYIRKDKSGKLIESPFRYNYVFTK